MTQIPVVIVGGMYEGRTGIALSSVPLDDGWHARVKLDTGLETFIREQHIQYESEQPMNTPTIETNGTDCPPTVKYNGAVYALVSDTPAPEPAKLGECWQPRDDEAYWYVIDEGECRVTTWANFPTHDAKRYAAGNCFPTEEEAQRDADYLRLLRRARRVRDGLRDEEEYTPDKSTFEPYIDSARMPRHSYAGMPIYSPWSFNRDESLTRFIAAFTDEELRTLITMP